MTGTCEAPTISTCAGFAAPPIGKAGDPSGLGATHRRPTAARVTVALLGLLALLLAGCAGDADDAPSPAAATAVADSFVGKIAEVDALVAVVSDGQRVRAYVCDGPARQIAEYAEGPADGAPVGLISRSGARFQIDVVAQAATGTITLPDGRTLPFHAAPATGAAGLYELTFTPDGSFGGGSASGASLAARVRDQQQLGPDRIRYTVAGAVVAPDGTAQPFARLIEGNHAVTTPIALREILTAGGESRGRGKGDASGFTDKEIDL